MTQSPSNLSEDLLNRLSDALAGTHGRELSLDAVKSLVNLEVQDWNMDHGSHGSPAVAAPIGEPLLGHRIRLSSD